MVVAALAISLLIAVITIGLVLRNQSEKTDELMRKQTELMRLALERANQDNKRGL